MIKNVNKEMELNAGQRGLSALHRAYNDCLGTEMRKFLELSKEARVQAAKETKEFCLDEKKKYLDHMRVHQPNEYENLERLDENLYM